jgi:transcriptional regulator with XRE-family HTH domain
MGTKHILITFLKNKREQLGFTQAEFAEFLDIPFNTYRAYEYGQNNLKPEALDHISKKLGVPVSEFFLEQDNEPKDSNKELVEVIKSLQDQLSAVSPVPSAKTYSWKNKTYGPAEIEKLKDLDRKLSMVDTCKEARTIFRDEEEMWFWIDSFWAIDNDWCEARVLLFFKRFHPRTHEDNTNPYSLALYEAPGWFRNLHANWQELTAPLREDKALQGKALA